MSSNSKSKIVVGAAIAALALTITGCSSGGATPTQESSQSASTDPALQTLIDAAKAEGSVTWYSGFSPAQLQPTADLFQKTYGITVDLVRVSSGPLVQRFTAEMQSGAPAADVLLQADPAFATDAGDQGWLLPLDEELVPNVANWPEDLVDGSYLKAITIPWLWNYNTDKLSEGDAPKSVEDLLKPEFTGQLLLNDPRTSGPVVMGFFNWLYDEYGADFLTDLSKQDLRVYPSTYPALESLAAGEGQVVFPAPAGGDADLIAAGAPLKSIMPTATVGFNQLLSVVADSPHPNAARLFANFILSPEGQGPLTNGAAASPLGHDAVPDSLVTPEGMPLIDPAQTAERSDEIVKLLGLQ
ncbi:ABC transporter substrate-binding protein [Compostimonas suwonensis]|uniref:Iron(III) transport system substrate-binding protein n=1 Tax=Compostimonas suwonensis TaxID=1048394 RepID=A0A2M9BWR8_9MICO|nr:extracellular solute-binding protein [Compostimonas suwonensis]PJJ62403.1 iron(III) transport system substrate-binding protein [Compostimonas suwonensis]